MTHHISIDIETFSDVDITKAGLYKYAQSPAFDILLIAWAKDDGPVQVVDLTLDAGANGSGRNCIALQEFWHDFYDPDSVLHAYNAAFEHTCLNTWLKRLGRPERPVSAWRCTMAHGLYCGYTAGLAATGEAMGLPQDKKKLGIGAALIRRFCVPQRPNRQHAAAWRIRPKDDPEKWALFTEYCRQDVEAEREIERRLSKWPMPEREQKLWEMTALANIEGVGVDTQLVDGAIEMGEAEMAGLLDEAREISGLANPKSVQQLVKWLNGEIGEEVQDLRKTTVSELLGKDMESDRARRMLEIRQLTSKTSTKKYDALRTAVCDDGRVRGMMFYYGANRTGRWAGRIVQPQNLPQNHLDSLPFARERVKRPDSEAIRLCFGSVPDTLSQLIRTAFVPREGKLFAVADYSAIEARVVAWLAGESWVLEAFEAGQDIYCATASQMFGVPVEKHGVNSELRQKGKIATLALGYGGGESALTAMGALAMGIPEEELPEIKAKWRKANPAICRLWRTAEDAAIQTIETGAARKLPIKVRDPERARENERLTGAEKGSYSDYFNGGACLTFRKEQDRKTEQEFLTIELPTGRKLFYAHPYLAPAKKAPDRLSLHYRSVDQASKKWAATDTWGGKIVENITQAVARDCLAETLIRLEEAGITAVFHVHDEVICEVDKEEQLDTILDTMARPIAWAPGLPLKGAGFVCEYYRKD